MPSRRNLIAITVGAAVAVLGGRTLFRAAGGPPSRLPDSTLAAFCMDLGCPDRVARACVQALPAVETSAEHLARFILAAMSSAGRDCTSVIALRRCIAEQSRNDFDRGKIVNVDGWMLSQTETRVYALTALLADKPAAAAGRSRVLAE